MKPFYEAEVEGFKSFRTVEGVTRDRFRETPLFSFRGYLVSAVGEVRYFHVFLAGGEACSLPYRGDVRRSTDGVQEEE